VPKSSCDGDGDAYWVPTGGAKFYFIWLELLLCWGPSITATEVVKSDSSEINAMRIFPSYADVSASILKFRPNSLWNIFREICAPFNRSYWAIFFANFSAVNITFPAPPKGWVILNAFPDNWIYAVTQHGKFIAYLISIPWQRCQERMMPDSRAESTVHKSSSRGSPDKKLASRLST